ncbi:MAG: hypothetical protein V5A68_03780 [Candidatus Thermoplasmatota archaeon]
MLESFLSIRKITNNSSNSLNNAKNGNNNKLISLVLGLILLSSIFIPVINSEILSKKENEEKNFYLIKEPILTDHVYSREICLNETDTKKEVKLSLNFPEIRYKKSISIKDSNNSMPNNIEWDVYDSDDNGMYDLLNISVSPIINQTLFFKIDFKKFEMKDYTTDVVGNPDGSKTAVIYPKPVNYKDDKTGFFKPINLTIVRDNSSSYPYFNQKNIFKSFFGEKGEVKFEKNNSWASTHPISQHFGDKQNATIQIKDRQIIYQDLFEEIDLRYTISEKKILEEYIVYNRSKNISKIRQILSYDNVNFSLHDNQIFFYNQSEGNVLFKIPEPVMWEEKNPLNRSYGLKYEITKLNDTIFLDKVLTENGRSWLNDENRSYPVVIDATWENTGAYEDGHIRAYNMSNPTYDRWTNNQTVDWGKNDTGDLNTSYEYRGYIQWDIDGLAQAMNEDEATSEDITQVVLNYHGAENHSVNSSIYNISNEPAVSSDQDVYTDAGDGSIYIENQTVFPKTLTNQSINLGDKAVNDLKNQTTPASSPSGQWFAIGLKSNDGNGLFEKIYSTEYSSADPKPTLNVTYNIPPQQKDEVPANGSTGVELTPVLKVRCIDYDEEVMDATWWTNESGSWTQFGSNNSITNDSIIQQTCDDFNEYNTKYYWSLNLTDQTCWTNNTYHFTTESNPYKQPVINNYDLINETGSKLNNDTGPLDIYMNYTFKVNITDLNGWGDIEFINITSWFDQGDENSRYNDTPGGNLNMFLQYKNISGGSNFSIIWPDYEAALDVSNCSEEIINETTRIIKIGFQPRNQIHRAESNDTWDSSQNKTNDEYSWNFNVTVTDQHGLIDIRKNEYGISPFTCIYPDKHYLYVQLAPGESNDTNIVEITYSSNYDYNMSIYFENNLTNTSLKSHIPVKDNLVILAKADLNDDLENDKIIQGVGEENKIEIFNKSGIFKNNNLTQKVKIQFNVNIPMGFYSGVYRARIATTMQQK